MERAEVAALVREEIERSALATRVRQAQGNATSVPAVAGLRSVVFNFTIVAAPVAVVAAAAVLPFTWPKSHDFVVAQISLLSLSNTAYINQVRPNGLGGFIYSFNNTAVIQDVRLTIISYGT